MLKDDKDSLQHQNFIWKFFETYREASITSISFICHKLTDKLSKSR